MDDFLREYPNLLGLSEADNFTYTSYQSPYDSAVTYIRMYQTYNSFQVDNSQLLLHLRNGYIEIIAGNCVQNLGDNRSFYRSSTYLDENTALQIAFSAINSEIDSHLQFNDSNDTTTDILPKGILKYAQKVNTNGTSLDYVFAWEFTLSKEGTDMYYRVLVNAYTGNIVELSDPKQYGMYRKGSVNTLYNGYRTADMETFKCDFCVNWTLESNNISTFLNETKLKDDDNVWVSIEEKPATSAHWAICKIRNFFQTHHSWQGYFNNSFKLFVRGGMNRLGADTGPNSDGVDIIGLGFTSNGKSVSSIDVIGHEYGHLIVKYTSGLVYSKESGALNEGFADIFGTMAEHQIELDINPNTSYDFIIGEDVGYHYRNMTALMKYQDNATGWQPATMTFDNYGVHTNCQVLGHWFYQLASRVNRFNAADIAFGTNLLLTPNDGYWQAKAGSLIVAEALGGRCSDLQNAVYDAWETVGVTARFEYRPNCPPLIIGKAQTIQNNDQANNSKTINSLIQNTYTNDTHPVIYPNPTSGNFNIHLPENMLGCMIDISYITGKKYSKI